LLDLKEVEKHLASATMDCNVFQQRVLATEAELARMSEFCKQHTLHIEELEAEIRKKNRLLDEYNTELRISEEMSHQELNKTADKLGGLESCLELLQNENSQLASRNTELQL